VALMGRRETRKGLSSANLKETGHWENCSVDGRIMIQLILPNENDTTLTGLNWLRIETDGGCF